MSTDTNINSVDWSTLGLNSLKNIPRAVNEDLIISNNRLTSLEGAPTWVGRHVDMKKNPLTTLKGWTQREIFGNFRINSTKLTSLEFAPAYVKESFYAADCKLTSLVGGPKVVNEIYECQRNRLTNFEGAPTHAARIEAGENKITSLKGLPTTLGTLKRTGYLGISQNLLTDLKHCPLMHGGVIDCQLNKLTSLEGVPNNLARLMISDNKFTSLQGIHKYFKNGNLTTIAFSSNLITSHLLGLLLIPGLTAIVCDNDALVNLIKTRAYVMPDAEEMLRIYTELDSAVAIIRKHLIGDKDVIDCQQELMEAGLKAYAQL